MKLEGLLSLIRNDARFRQFIESARALTGAPHDDERFPALSLDLLEAARPFVVAALQRDWPGPVVLVSGRPEQARHLADQVRIWSGEADRVLYFHAPDTVFYDRTPWDRETTQARVNVLSSLLAVQNGEDDEQPGRGLVVTASIWALMTRSVSPMAFRRATRTLRVGDVIPFYRFLEHCVRAGYEPVAVVEEPGTFSHRGSIVDIFPPNREEPLRIDFFGDEIDSIRAFNPATQRSQDTLQEVALPPAGEALPEWGKAAASALQGIDLSHCNSTTRQHMGEEIEKLIAGNYFTGIEFYLPYLYPRPSTLLDFMPENTLLLVDDLVTLETAAIGLENQATGLRAEMIEDGHLPANYAVPYLTWDEIKERLAADHAINMGYGADESPALFRDMFMAAPHYGGQMRDALSDIAELRHTGERVVLVSRQAERLADLLREQNVYSMPVEDLLEPPNPSSITLVDGILAEGWVYIPGHLVMLTDAEVFGWTRMRRRRPTRPRRTAPETFFADLQDGDYVVHVEYGIGRYHGMVRKAIGNLEREYLEIEYASGDRLFVPIHQADRVSRYLGADEREPYMHRLGSSEWATVRSRAERAVRDIAAELLELYAAREVAPGHAFAPDNEWQHEMEQSFPYEETADQLRALDEVKSDMERPKPMDRLICGDVGYGKTEVALRAAFKAVMDGKQVAVLVPTTVLAQQHFHTFRRRLRAFPVTIEMLSRFRSPQEQEMVLEDLAAGRVDIIVGTHRLLSKDVTFKDLGMLIIDEEQRFGVSHKEHFKALRREIDVLTLTATPIPRTLYMALSSIRDMSIIDTPPEDRLAVRTFVTEYDEATLRKAILRELDRGGQIYFVHNRVQDIEQVAIELHRIVPEASLVIGHGQIPEDQLAQVMLGFAQGEYDILLCTTIIESGLDIPNVNTIIIDNANTFGLAQLYQLRGRVGRGVNRAYAYLLYKPPLTDIARQRLQAIQEASELGAGFRVAMRDMEIRGAGEILGAEQHGHIAAVGFDLYTRLLQQAVDELREESGEPIEAIRRAQHATAAASVAALGYGPSIDLPVSAYLPEEFISDGPLRLRLYRRLARIESINEIDDVEQEMRDRFGDLTEPASGLLYLLRVRVLASEAGVLAIKGDGQQIALALPLPLTADAVGEIAARHPAARARGTRVWLPLQQDWQIALQEVLGTLAELNPVGAGVPAG
ncbi:MAG: transcription-repair coupling factor [Anaerolineae bacterium]